MSHTDETNPSMVEDMYTKLMLEGARQNVHEETVRSTNDDEAAENSGHLADRDILTGNSQIQ